MAKTSNMDKQEESLLIKLLKKLMSSSIGVDTIAYRLSKGLLMRLMKNRMY